MAKVAVLFVGIILSLTPALAAEQEYCLPIGHPSLSKLPLDAPHTLQRDLRLGKVVIPKGCFVRVEYGPEISEDQSQQEKDASKIIQFLECGSGVKIGKFFFSKLLFNRDFCVDSQPTLAKPATACGIKRDAGTELVFGNGKLFCNRPGEKLEQFGD